MQVAHNPADADYRYWRVRIFSALFYGYALYYFTRKSVTFVMPAIMDELGYTPAQLGWLGTLMALAYGVSKFTSGILTDRTNPRLIMGLGLVLSGCCNIAFGLCSSLVAFMILWALNGWFQGFGAPPCARLLVHWYPRDSRGRWWALWNTSHNVGGFLIAQLAAGSLVYFSWRAGMWIPGIICIIGGCAVFWQIRDTPESLGLPPVDPEITPTSKERLSVRELLVDNVLRNPYVLMLAISYFFVYVVRAGVSDWATLYLVKARGFEIAPASATAGLFEIGGLFGSLVAGWGSDHFFNGRRAPVSAIMMVGVLMTAISLWLSFLFGAGFDQTLILMSGFFIFGPQMLVGMAAAEVVDKKAAATVTGFVGVFAYLGAAAAGAPLGWLIEHFGWGQFFVALIASSAVATFLLLPLWLTATGRRISAQPATA